MKRFTRVLAVTATALAMFGAAQANAAPKINFILNWIAGGDHAPYYYAQKMGWYKAAGLDLNIQQGKGSSMSAQRTGAGKNQIGLADMPPVFAAIAKGADLVAVMNVYANSPYGFLLAEKLRHQERQGLRRQEDRQPALGCGAQDVAGLRRQRRYR